MKKMFVNVLRHSLMLCFEIIVIIWFIKKYIMTNVIFITFYGIYDKEDILLPTVIIRYRNGSFAENVKNT